MKNSKNNDNLNREYEAQKERSTVDAVTIAENHVNWFLDLIKPLLISHFVHGYKHGLDKRDGKQ